MKVTYLNHSGFLLEWEHSCWLFDYYKGEIPKMDPGKDIFVFCSHSHEDHFNPEIFTLAEQYPSVTYLFSNQVRRSCRRFQKETETYPVRFLLNRKDYEVMDSYGQGLYIHTLQSTDCGCAFLIRYEGHVIYHAGDLHWWYWPGEPEMWNKKMTADYKKEMEYLEGQWIDLAFTPLDPRLEEAYGWGMNYLLEKAEVKHVFPMHFWNRFEVMGRYLNAFQIPEGTQFHAPERDGQCVEIKL